MPEAPPAAAAGPELGAEIRMRGVLEPAADAWSRPVLWVAGWRDTEVIRRAPEWPPLPASTVTEAIALWRSGPPRGEIRLRVRPVERQSVRSFLLEDETGRLSAEMDSPDLVISGARYQVRGFLATRRGGPVLEDARWQALGTPSFQVSRREPGLRVLTRVSDVRALSKARGGAGLSRAAARRRDVRRSGGQPALRAGRRRRTLRRTPTTGTSACAPGTPSMRRGVHRARGPRAHRGASPASCRWDEPPCPRRGLRPLRAWPPAPTTADASSSRESCGRFGAERASRGQPVRRGPPGAGRRARRLGEARRASRRRLPPAGARSGRDALRLARAVRGHDGVRGRAERPGRGGAAVAVAFRRARAGRPGRAPGRARAGAGSSRPRQRRRSSPSAGPAALPARRDGHRHRGDRSAGAPGAGRPRRRRGIPCRGWLRSSPRRRLVPSGGTRDAPAPVAVEAGQVVGGTLTAELVRLEAPLLGSVQGETRHDAAAAARATAFSRPAGTAICPRSCRSSRAAFSPRRASCWPIATRERSPSCGWWCGAPRTSR